MWRRLASALLFCGRLLYWGSIGGLALVLWVALVYLAAQTVLPAGG